MTSVLPGSLRMTCASRHNGIADHVQSRISWALGTVAAALLTRLMWYSDNQHWRFIMRLQDYLDFLGPNVIRLKGHRIGLEDIIEAHQDGESPEQIAAFYQTVTLEQVYGAITYYLRHRAETDEYIQRVNAIRDARIQAAEPSDLTRRLRDRMDARERRVENERATEVSPG
jgi:uncharacterized protein (DUF433 family)